METRHRILEVWRSDLVDYFQWLLKKDIAEVEEVGKPEEVSRAAELKERLENLQKSHYYKWFGQELQKYCQFRNLKTQRETSLSPFLEHARCVRTWQSFDYNIWRACLEKTEKPRVAAEDKFLEQVRRGIWSWAGATRYPGGGS